MIFSIFSEELSVTAHPASINGRPLQVPESLKLMFFYFKNFNKLITNFVLGIFIKDCPYMSRINL